MSETTARKGISRRGFLKTSAAVAGMAAVSSNTIQALATESTIADSGDVETYTFGCRSNCGGGCIFHAIVKDGVLIGTEPITYPYPEFSRMCVRGHTHAQRMYAAERIKTPLKRVEGSERGSGQWEQISWDEAERIITEKWQSYIEEFGISAIAFYFYGGKQGALMQMQSAFLSLSHVTNVLGQIDQGIAIGPARTIGSFAPAVANGPGNWVPDLSKARNYFIQSGDFVCSNVFSTGAVHDLRARGGKVVVIDPCYTPTVARLADIHVPLRAGTDGLFWFGMMHVAIDENLTDEPFLKAHTVAPFLVKETDGKYLRLSDLLAEGEVLAEDAADEIVVMAEDGTVGPATANDNPVIHGTFNVQGHEVTTAYDLLIERIDRYPLEECAEACDIPVELIRQCARLYADGPTSLYLGEGSDHYGNSYTALETAAVFGGMVGMFLKEGASQCNPALPPGAFPGGADASRYWIANHKEFTTEAAKKVSNVDFARCIEEGTLANGEPITIKSLYVSAANPMTAWPERKRTIEAFDKLDLVIVSDMVWSETAQYADIVLPASYWGEYELFFNSGSTGSSAYAIAEKFAEPAFDTRPDIEHFNIMYRALGMDDCVCPSSEEWTRMSVEKSASLQTLGITYENLKAQDAVQCYDHPSGLWKKIAEKFPTATGRMQFYTETPTVNKAYPVPFDVDMMRLPHWFPPVEAWPYSAFGFEPTAEAEKYPLHLTATRSRYSAHSSYSLTPWLNELDGDPYVRMNPKDADARGLGNGDMVKLYNDRGYVTLKLRADGGVRPGMLVAPVRWQGDQFADGNIADLPTRKQAGNFENVGYKECMVEAVKA